MRTAVERKLEMVARVREFCLAHPSADPWYATVLGRLEERLTRAQAIAKEQRDGLVAARAASSRRQELKGVIHRELLPYLVLVGDVLARSRAELIERFKLPNSHWSNAKYLAAAKDLLALAESQRDALVAEGMAPGVLEELARLVAEFEVATEAARTARRLHIGARAGLETVTGELMEQVRVLDRMNRWRYRKLGLLAQWLAAKHVPGTPTRVTPLPVAEVVDRPEDAPPGSGGATHSA